MALPAGSKRLSGDWCPELWALADDPYVMLLGGVVMRARWDAEGDQWADGAQEFLNRVKANWDRTGEVTWAVMAAMREKEGRREPPIKGLGGGRGLEVSPRAGESRQWWC